MATTSGMHIILLLSLWSLCIASSGNRIVAYFWVQKVMFISLMHFRFGNQLSFFFYSSYVLFMLLYPVICLWVCKILLNLIVSNHKNSDLIQTIRYILQVFPESVIIRSPGDGASKNVFVNDAAKYEIEGKAIECDAYSKNNFLQLYFVIHEVSPDSIWYLRYSSCLKLHC